MFHRSLPICLPQDPAGPEPRLHNPAMARSKEDFPVPEAPSKSKDSPDATNGCFQQ